MHNVSSFRAALWVAHASGVLASASARSRTSATDIFSGANLGKACFGATPKPARRRRALPRLIAKSVQAPSDRYNRGGR
jgi:hypothetical protein